MLTIHNYLKTCTVSSGNHKIILYHGCYNLHINCSTNVFYSKIIPMWSLGEVSDPGLKSCSDSKKLYASASAYQPVIIVCLTYEEHKGRIKLP